jgi:glycosyltransferase involved in cell wall biosynthesis
MKENIKIGDLKILYICPSNKWGTLERRTLADTVYFRNIGGSPVLYCIKESHLDCEAETEDISRIYFDGRFSKKFSTLNYYLHLRKVIRENEFDVIHCYSLKFVWVICLLMLANLKIPLFLTFNRFLYLSQKSLLKRWLFKRIDAVFVFSPITKEIVREYLPVSERKIHLLGAGIEFLKTKKELSDTYKKIGCFIPRDFKNLSTVKTIIYAILPLVNAVEDLSLDFKVHFYFESDSEELDQMAEVKRIVEELAIEQYVSIESGNRADVQIYTLDMLISADFSEPFNDLEVAALLHSVPIVVPRTASRQSLIKLQSAIGESYREGDSRELKGKMLKILINEMVYREGLSACHEQLIQMHGLDNYFEKLLELYQNSVVKRKRYNLKKSSV